MRSKTTNKYLIGWMMLLLACLAACTNKTEHSVLEPLEYLQAINSVEHLQLIDVRSPEEFRSGHIKGAINFNYRDNNFRERVTLLDKEQPVYLYCRSGNRSAKAAQILKEEGFVKIYDLKGGILNWENNNLMLNK
ncbi:MAG TPA: rhodanese-like domain-containing protein [Cytophagaceae bacterium]